MSFTKDEWVAVGFTAGVYDELGPSWFDDLLKRAWVPGHESSHCLAMRLALAHPERAGEALGPGWSMHPVGVVTIMWQYREPVASGMGMHVQSPNHPPRILVYSTGTVEAVVRHYLPLEFDAALARARLIAAAWQRIEEAKVKEVAGE